MIPLRYIPYSLSKKDKQKQMKELMKSKKMYKTRHYYTREKIKSFQSKPSQHVINARRIYQVDNVVPSKELSLKTGCSIKALQQIVKKGQGAYFSSGSRPNQTAQSWGLARLASSITGGKAAAVDYAIIDKGCSHTKKAFKLAKESKKYKYGSIKHLKDNHAFSK